MKCQFGISFERNLVFITRVSRFNKIEQLNKNIDQVLAGSKFNWKQYLIFDMTKIQNFDQNIICNLKNVECFFVEEKTENEQYMAFAIDNAARNIEDKDTWIYILDDDNKLLPQFKDLAWDLDANYPITIFNINMPMISNGFNGTIKAPLECGKALFHIDMANFITQRKVLDQICFKNNIKSEWADGVFIQKALKTDIPIKYVDKVYGQHNCGE